MKWWCALIQRWLPEHLDGDLNSFRSRRLKGHLDTCPSCRQELVELGEVVAALQAQPVGDPGPAFWDGFGRELHLKLARVQQFPARRGLHVKLPYYLMGAPALAILLLWVSGYWVQVYKPWHTPRGPALVQLAAPEQLVYAGLDDGLWQAEEFPSWDVNAVLADLSDQERELVLQKIKY